MITQAPKRELDVDFSIIKIKATIDSTGNQPGIRIHSKNDLFNTYRISITKGFYSGFIDITLQKIDENKTHCLFQIFNAGGGTASPVILSRLQDSFLAILSKALLAKPLTSQQVAEIQKQRQAKEKKFRNVVYGFIAIVVIIVLFVLFKSWYHWWRGPF